MKPALQPTWRPRFALVATVFLGVCSAPFSFATTWYVEASSPDSTGTKDKPFRTISEAAAVAQPGDEVVVRDGVYRERVSPARSGTVEKPIVYRAENPHRAIVRGSEVWAPAWRPFGSGNVVFAPWDAAIFPEANPFLLAYNENWKAGPPDPARPKPVDGVLPLTTGQVFLRGIPLRQAATLADLERVPASWMTSPDGTGLLVHFEREPEEIEVTVRSRIFAPRERGLTDIRVEGFCFEHCANQLSHPQNGAVSTRSGKRWTIRNNIIRFAGTIGLDCGSEGWKTTRIEGEPPGNSRIIPGGEHLVEDNVITDNGLSGISAWKISRSVFRRNVVERNNRLGFSPTSGILVWEMAGIKLLDGKELVVEDNLVRDNECFGIWLDNGYEDSRVSRNVVLNNYLAGIFIEYGMPRTPGESDDRVLIDNNIVAGTRDGDGIYAHDASGLTVAHNLLAQNSGFGVRMRVLTDRVSHVKFLTQSSDATIVNNIIAANGVGAIALPMPSARSQRNVSDGNLLLQDNWDLSRARARFRFEGLGATALKDITPEDTARLLERYRAAAEASPNLGWVDAEIWKQNPLLTLKQWRRLEGQDQASMESGSPALILRSLTPEVEFRFAKPWTLPAARPIEDVTSDFFGRPMRGLPGPFQQDFTNRATIGIWPPR
jgi:parallel beta-helix repeat protein